MEIKNWKRQVQITGWGFYVPQDTITNADLERTLDTNNEWIVSRTGIEARRRAAPHETTATLATNAAQAALTCAGLTATELDAIIVATTTPDDLIYPTACLVQAALDAPQAAVKDVQMACAGFIGALQDAVAHIEAGFYQTVLVIGSETLTRVTDPLDRGTAIIFGDGAGALILQRSTQGRIFSFSLRGLGHLHELITIPAGGSRIPASHESITARQHYMKMEGQAVFKVAARAMAERVQESCDLAHVTLSDIHLFVPHQANLRIIKSVAKILGLMRHTEDPLPDRVYSNIQKYGNTSAASIPIALCEALQEGRVKDGDLIGLAAFGAGLTSGGGLIQWGKDVSRG